MSEGYTIKLNYLEISERIEWLLGMNSRLVRVENASETLKDSIYMWDEATRVHTLAKAALIEDYMNLVTRVRLDLEDQQHPYQMNSFDHSCKTVLHYLKQDTYVWEASPQAVLRSVQRELDLQYCILTQSVEV
ncbi:hypothetical protein MHI24_09540 [Paenibacillus sp. FSL K6-1096]|uniref:hypothetical protein n=1 Tax=Paenibacillus sp. FSL K6-1096 TaxID=2921460 RepID=UPI0030EC63E5